MVRPTADVGVQEFVGNRIMGDSFKSNFKGKGSLVAFVKEVNAMFSAINNMVVQVPTGYEGVPPTVQLDKGQIVFDFGDALLFSRSNIVWNFSGTGFTAPNNVKISYKNATVVNGQLTLSIVVDKV